MENELNMSDNQKHKVATDALETLGTIIDETAGRDAIHLAVEPVIAADILHAGDDIGLVDGKATHYTKNKIGIVDPFLKEPVQPGERFWMVIYPRQITSLRHVWEHPDIPVATETTKSSGTTTNDKSHIWSASKRWLRDFASGKGVEYDELMEHAAEYVAYGDYWNEGGRFDGEWVPDEFWLHYQIVTGTTVPERRQGSFFSCSC